MMATKMIVPEKNLKIKFSNKRIEAAGCGVRSCNTGRQVSLGNDYSMVKTSGPGANKRGPLWIIEGQKEKKWKMDRSLMEQCSMILERLMSHDAAWVFNQPVDPVALNIPDYFSIISKPMDLGTVKSKLQKNMYSGIEEFAADIRLTFANAMLYNPPDNCVHKMAKKLNLIFETRWKLLENKCDSEGAVVGSGKPSSVESKKVINMTQKYVKTAPLGNSLVPRRSIPSKEMILRSSLEKSDAKEVDHSKTANNSMQKLGSREACHSANAKRPSIPTLRKCGSCGSIPCRCRSTLSSDSTHVSSSDISSDRSLGRYDRACSEVSRLDCQAKSTSTSQISKSDPESDGAVSALDDENTCPSSQLTTPVTNAAFSEWNTPPLDIQVSPRKALRAAMLKCRYADTILRAQQKVDNDDRSDPEKLKQEKERLERRQREEKARIEAQIRAAEAASRVKAEIEVKQQRERERAAARVALKKMEEASAVEMKRNLDVRKELEMLCGFTSGSAYSRSPLEKLGLFLKDLDEDEEAMLNGDGEEGEIFYRN